MDNKVLDMDYMALNAMVDLYAYDENGKKRIQIEKDAQATRQYFLQHVDKNTHYFPLGLEYKIDFLLVNGYYDPEFLKPYGYTHCTPDDPSRDEVMAQNKDAIRTLKKLYDRAYKKKFRFESFIGAYKFYTSYALKTFDSTSESVTYLERWEDRVVAVAMYLAKGDVAFAEHLIDEIISGKFQPATPTFQNAGKLAGGHLVSCFLLSVPDSLEGWMRGIADGGQLSKLGGGVGYCLTDIRPAGDPLKGMVGLSKGVLPYMKILEDLFSAVDQLGQRPGAAAAYLHANHMDIMDFLDTKRENADEKVRIKTLSLGIVMPDIVFELAKNNEDMYTFSSHDVLKEYGVELSRLGVTKHYREMVENPRIRKGKVNARRFLQTIAELQFESGYPYVVFEDTVNRANAIDGYINMSNLCSEILQVSTPSKMNPDLSFTEVGRDISCNLGSLNIAKALDGKNLAGTVETAIRALSAVSDMSSIDAVPSVKNGNSKSHAIGLGQMNLHGFFAREGIQYGDEVSLDFTNIYFYTVAYHAIRTSNLIATERGETFFEFEKSKYASGEYFEKYTKNVGDKWTPKTEKVRELFKRFHVEIPSVDDWENLRALVMEHGIYNAYLQAVPPTGSISYINNSTASIHPITAPNGIEKRIEGKLGKVISPAPFLSEETLPFYRKTAYDLMDETLQVYGQAAQHVDQGQSLTLFTTDTSSTRDMMKVLMRAWKLGNKTVYYTRTAASALAGTADEGCVSCAL